MKDKLKELYNVSKATASNIKSKGLYETIENVLDDPQEYYNETSGRNLDKGTVKPYLKASTKDVDKLTGNKGTGKALENAVKGKTPKATPRAGIGGKILGGLGVGLETYNTGKAMADPYATWQSRALDAAALGGMGGATYLGGLLGHPVIGAGIGEVISAPARNLSANIRGMNRGLNTASITMTPEEQAAYNDYLQYGLTRNQINSIGKNVEENLIPPEQSNPKNFPYKTTTRTPTSNVSLPSAPRIQDINPNPEIIDQSTGQPRILEGQVAQNVDTNGDPVQTTGAASQITFSPYQSTIDYNLTSDERELLNSINNSENKVSAQQIYQSLVDNYNNALTAAKMSDPRYQGDILLSQGYNVDPDIYRRLAQSDMISNNLASNFGIPQTSNKAQQYLDRQRQLYEINMANQAGVPYEEYKTAMLERQKQQIALNQKQVEDTLKFQLQQTSDEKQKIALLQEIYKSRIGAQKDLDVANANAYGDIIKQQVANLGSENVANITQQGGINKQVVANMGTTNVANINAQAAMDRLERELNDPSTQAQAISRIYSSLGYLPPELIRRVLPALPQNIQQLLYGGKLTPAQVNELLGLPNMDMIGNESSNFNRFMSKIRGIQANEQ